jgi:hypothetical protein
LSSGAGFEVSETVTHEFSAGFEWSYTAMPCQYCNPKIYFTAARLRVYSRRLLGLPLLYSRKTIFDSGPSYEVRADCRSNAEECGDCAGSQVTSGSSPLLKASSVPELTHLERVVFDSRSQRPNALQTIAKAVATDPESGEPTDHLYLLDLHNRVSPIASSDEGVTLYSVDDLDRALGAVRIYENANVMLFLARGSGQTGPAGEPTIILELENEAGDMIPTQSSQLAAAQFGGVRVTSVNLIIATTPTPMATQPASTGPKPPGSSPAIVGHARDVSESPHGLRLRMRYGQVERTWPAVMVQR